MSEVIKTIVTLEELDALKRIQNSFNELALILGQFEIQLLELKESKEEILKKVNILKQEKNQLGTNLNQKYGAGTIDLDTGEFIKV
jgi:hypothetical protein